MISVFGSKIGREEIDAVTKVMESQWIGLGKKVDEFEEEFKNKFNIENFIMVDSGSNALYMAVRLLDLPKGSEIILPSFTWVSCAHSIILAGHIPIFCDVDIKTMNVTKATIEKQITEKTKAIMVVHYAGLPVDMDPILELGYPVIEDAAHAVYSKYKGKHCGNIGDIGIYSFDAVKNLTAAEGGGLTCRDPKMLLKAKTLRYCGIGKSGFESISTNNKWWEYNIEDCFIKMLPNNITASIAMEQLRKIDELQSVREMIWNEYQSSFSGNENIITPSNADEGDKHSYFTYSIRVPERDKLAKYLLDNGIYTTLRYHPLHMNKIYNSDKKLENSEILNNDCLSIPLHPRLTIDDVKYIIEKVIMFYGNYKKEQ